MNKVLDNVILWRSEASERYGFDVEVIEKAVDEVYDRVAGRKMCVYESDHPGQRYVVGLVTSMEVGSNASIRGDVELLETECGKKILRMLAAGVDVKFGVTIRAPLDRRPCDAVIMMARVLDIDLPANAFAEISHE